MAGNRSWTDAQLQEAVAASTSLRHTLLRLGLAPIGGNHATLRRHIARLGLDISHFDSFDETLLKARRASALVTSHTPETLEARVFVRGSLYTKTTRKYALRQLGGKCGVCGQLPWWNGAPLTLQVDHIDGDTTNNELGNLRLICPNCHTQTHNFGSKNAGNYKRRMVERKTHCVQNAAALCGCGGSNPPAPTKPGKGRPTKIEWPSDEDLRALLAQSPATLVACRLGVSDSALAKRCRTRGIPKPGRGYWAKTASTHHSSLGSSDFGRALD